MNSATQRLADFVAASITELNRREAELRDEINTIAKERAALEAALDAAIRSTGSGWTAPPPLQPQEEYSTPSRRTRHQMTIKEAILHVLGGGVGGMTALNILDEIETRTGMRLERTSLSPQLSRLKADGLIKRDGVIWSIASTETNEAHADGNPQCASKTEDGEGDTLPDFMS